MKEVWFKNESGDAAYPVLLLDIELTDGQITEWVKSMVGDDYEKENDHLCGHWFLQDEPETLIYASEIVHLLGIVER